MQTCLKQLNVQKREYLILNICETLAYLNSCMNYVLLVVFSGLIYFDIKYYFYFNIFKCTTK